MTPRAPGGTFRLADDLVLSRIGYGAMQLAGPGVMGPPKDRDAAIAVLRAAVEAGVTHIDTSDYYGPVITNGDSLLFRAISLRGLPKNTITSKRIT